MVGEVGILAVAVDVEFLGHALAPGKSRYFDGLVHRVLGHQAVGGPLAAGDRHQTVVRGDDLVAARNLLRVLALLLGRRQRTLTREYREDVLVGGRRVHVESRGAEDEVDLLLQRTRLLLRGGAHDVGRSDHDLVVPGHGEQHAAVRGLGNHDRIVALQEFHVQHEVHALARGDHLAVFGAVHVHDVVDEAAGGVHDAARLDRILLAGGVVDELHAGDLARLIVQDARHGGLVDDRAAVLDAGLGEVDGHARVVELSVVVDHAALQPLFDRGGDVFHHFLGGDVLRTSVAEAEREQVVEGQAAEVKEIVPVAVVRNDERLVLHQMRGVGLHAAALAQRFKHQHHVALLQVAHAAVHEFGRAARRTFRKVGLLQAGYAHAARGCIHRDAESGRTAAYDYHVPDFALVGQLFDL